MDPSDWRKSPPPRSPLSILTSPLLRSLSFTRYASDDDEEETAAA
eukprot:CAMPEP_0197507272 /NCGR_PEP_ID=MMETSP1312-20131121/14463_1 /TAXON_ID=464262 /ORGANISM="Genus nov. species nov., Strain RCC2335" /LENGTH=44 /DNA_ID= /DNA_START= /DNA_END= /DNA_ORIENTATION=